MAKNDVGHRLLAHWKSRYRDKHGEAYVGSKYRDSAMLRGIAEDIDEDELLELMDWYFDRKSRNSFQTFIFDYAKLRKEKRHQERDQEERERLRERTRQLMQERE